MEQRERFMSRTRIVVYVTAVLSALSLAWLMLPGLLPADIQSNIAPTGSLNTVLDWIFWVSFVILLVALYLDRASSAPIAPQVEGPGFARFLFSSPSAGLFWLPIRLFMGASWLEAGIHKFNDPAWFGGSGSALLGYWNNAVAIPAAPGHPAITYDWYRGFLQMLIDNHAEGWFAQLITLGEMAVGVGLLLGALTGLAAFFGAMMNVSYLLAGSTSSNPVLFAFAIGLVLAWRVAGYYGLDRWLLPRLGTPWQPGSLLRRRTDAPVRNTS